MLDLVKNKEFWAEGTGLLPIHLMPNDQKQRYILLDGGRYDFCLDLTGEESDVSRYYSDAWSSDVKNYIVIKDENAIVYNWSRQKAESVKLRNIKDKFKSFLNILNSTNYYTSEDITPFILGLFAQLRNLTRERQEPLEALNLLFKLLVSLEEDNLSQLVCEKWGIANVNEPIGFEALHESIRQGVRGISPNLDFILRHGSGPLFETAHRETLYFDSQFDLFGGISSQLYYASQAKYSGIHYTPRYLVRSIVENAIKGLNLNSPMLTILDPACGSGAFLQEVLKQLREKNFSGDLVLKGFDISPMATQTTKFLLEYENRTLWNNKLRVIVEHKDSLFENWGQNDLILMNPPFLSYELIKDSETKEQINIILQDVQMKKRPNEAAAFFYKAILSLTNQGVVGAVLPSSILIQEQYLRLREIVRQQVKLETVAQLGNFVFQDALADTTFIIAKKQTMSQYTPLTIWCSNHEKSAYEAMKGWRKMQYDNSLQRIEDNYNIYTPLQFPLIRNSWKILPQSDDQLIRDISWRTCSGNLKAIHDIFAVRQGVIKGNRNLFEVEESDYENIPKMEKRFFRQIASSQTIEKGYVKEGRYIWYPYSQFGLLIKTEEDLKKYEWSYNWLKDYKEILTSRKGVNQWWELTRPRVELFVRKERLLCSKRSGGSHSFAIAQEGCVIEEGNVFMFKNSKYCEEDKYFYLAFFSSSTFQRLLSIFARPIKAGYDMGNVQIKDIPIVDVSQDGFRESKAYKELVRLGMAYAEGYIFNQDLFDEYVSSFY